MSLHIFLLVGLFLNYITFFNFEIIKSEEDISVSKIWDNDEYSAFTDLIHFNNTFYCSFRVGKKHVGYEDFGKVRILKSIDGSNWQSFALLEKEYVDLRDPKLSVTSDGQIMVIMAGAFFDENNSLKELYPMVSFSDNNVNSFSVPQKVALDPSIQPSKDWIWRVTWDGNTGYGIDYQIKEDDRDRSHLADDAWLLYLLKTKDGKSFDKVSKLEVNHLPNESTIRFDQNKNVFVLIRRESGDKMGVLAKSSFPYKNWSYTKLDYRFGGPNFLFLNDKKLVIGTRKYDKKSSTCILVTNLNGEVLKEIELPSEGDTSYPGLVIHNSELWVSYYSGHEGNSNIYLAQIPLNKLL